ncbi:Alpha/Beta hydrolase protein [Astrocystis sublimbata]|nr:Alpha/Beta hydrolase protein [Astrocystis sublimbata]
MERPQDKYLAKPSGECCLSGTIHEGKAKGTWETIEGVDTYVATPPSEKANGNVLMYFPDVWGMFPNGFLIMDAFADAGYLTLGLDYFRGDPVWKHRKDRHDGKTDPDFDYEAWKIKHITFANEATPRWIQAVTHRYKSLGSKFACVGYCFGAPYVCDELAKDTVTCGAFAHPAFLKESHFQNIKKPLFMSCAEIDHTFQTSERRRAIDILQTNKQIYHLQLFGGIEHGFALRGNPDDPYERWVKEQSLAGIVGWFDYWLAQSESG